MQETVPTVKVATIRDNCLIVLHLCLSCRNTIHRSVNRLMVIIQKKYARRALL